MRSYSYYYFRSTACFVVVLSFCFLFMSCLSNNKISTDEVVQREYKTIAYVNKWEDNWGEDYWKAKQITHINYAFANIKNGETVEGDTADARILKKIIGLKKVNKDLKVLISVGGWTWSKNFSDAALTKKSREIFVKSTIEFMLRHKLDGIDLDWEYPGQVGDGNKFRSEDKENFTLLLKLFRERMNSIATDKRKYLLTIATGANQQYLDHTNMREAHEYLDFINIMTYDFHGGWESKTGHNANLTVSKYDDNQVRNSAAHAVQEHIDAGIPAKKIVLGIPFYGRYWKGVIPKNNGLYQLANGPTGSYDYRTIDDSLSLDNSLLVYWDTTAQVPYIWRSKDSLFISYENATSIRYKVNYIKNNQLGGVMFWQLDGDNGTLLHTISDGLQAK